MSCVLIIGLESNIALAAVRSLGARGVKVIGISTGPNALGATSKYLNKEYILSWNPQNTTSFIDNIYAIAHSHSCDALMTPSETCMRLLNKHRERAPDGLNFCFPPASNLESVLCKDLTIPAAESVGLSIPRTMSVVNAAELHQAAECASLPVVLKFSTVGLRPEGELWNFKTSYVETREALHSLADKFTTSSVPLLVQEYAKGRYAGLGIACCGGKLLAAFQWIALREYEAGLGSFRVSVKADPKLVEKSMALLSAVGFDGVAEVEFRQNQETGLYTFMEVNPRLWGGMALPIACGVDFPWLSYCIATGRAVEPITKTNYTVGKYSRNLSGDIRWFCNAVRGKYINEHLNMRYQPLRAVLDMLLSIGKFGVFDQESLQDVRPFYSSIAKKIYKKIHSN